MPSGALPASAFTPAATIAGAVTGRSFPKLPGIKTLSTLLRTPSAAPSTNNTATASPETVLAKRQGLGCASVERFYHEYTRRTARERSDGICPPVLGIDEHSIHRKRTRTRRGTRFATTLCNLRTHRVFDIVEGRDPQDLEAYFAALKGRDKVRVICMDLSSSYRWLVRKYFPKAKIVADRFHVIRVVQQHFMDLVRQIATDVKKPSWLPGRSTHQARTPLSRPETNPATPLHPASEPRTHLRTNAKKPTNS